ncbi:Cytochrome P450 [Mycolicibacterium fluoranthenivorans]|uniref:Cytochrome P450 n=2 Tax=Mycolicibacterium fluoranthenivorans TaxID=258505 RepID=A0A1G4W3U6_9MYCO|nr:Cytochrome P450 [Mycolicibacterium fluoranthenivorans]
MRQSAGSASSDFAYDPFDPAVMANPLPYYRVLRDRYPVYYLPKWDTYALSRFADIWDVLAINDGTFVPSEGTLPAATILARHHDGPVSDPPLHPMPFHANFDSPLYEDVRRCTSGQFRPRTAATFADRIRRLANDRLDALLPLGSFDLTQDYGGIVAASMVCELVGLPVELAPDVLATVNAGSLAEPGSGVEVANARPGYLEYLTPIIERRRAGAGPPLAIADNLIDYRLPDGSGFTDMEAAVQMLGVFIGGTETVPKIVAHGLWELLRHPGQLAAVRADLDANVPVAREEMIRYCAPAQWFARTLRKPFTLHGTTVNPGQRIITLLGSAARDDREYVNPDDFQWDRRSARILSFGRGTHFCLGVHLARLEITILVTEWLKRVPEFTVREEAASRPPSSFQWGWNSVPVDVGVAA